MDVERVEAKIVVQHQSAFVQNPQGSYRNINPAVRSSNSPRLRKRKKRCYDEPESRVPADTTLVRVALRLLTSLSRS